MSHATLAEEMLSVQQKAPQLLLYLVDDIVWHMGFNSADRQEKVAIKLLASLRFLELFHFFQVRREKGIHPGESVWLWQPGR